VDLRIERYERVEDVPPEVLSALSGYASGKEFEWDAREIRDHAVYWVGYLDGQVVGTRMSRRGQYFRSWFVPLEKNDIVIFRGRTLPPFRGRGISAVMLRYIISREVAAGGRAFTDCDVYNKPSIRAIGKAGFRRIATKKSISRREALGAA
jgi:RimJ/RimL family protein N-acetyltransferase